MNRSVSGLRRQLNRALKRFLLAGAPNGNAGLRVLGYHSVDTVGSIVSISLAELRNHLSILREDGWRALSMAEFVARVNGAPGRSREVLITFDDGFENFYTRAAPLLAELGIPATVFLVTDLLGGAPTWLQRDEAAIDRMYQRLRLPSRGAERARHVKWLRYSERARLMSWPQVRELAKYGFDFQSHSAAHHFLSSLPARAVAEDLCRSREALADNLGAYPEALAYPYGDCNGTVVDVAMDVGFRAGFLAEYKGSRPAPMRTGRIQLNGTTPPWEVHFALSRAVDYHAAFHTALNRFFPAVAPRWSA